MANSKGPASFRSMMYNAKNPLLPPKSPFPSISPSYAEYIPCSAVPPKAFPIPREGNSHHQRTSSENFLIEEQPSWLDELLNEPDTPVRKGGHRRSSSDSFAYTDSANVVSMNYVAQDDNKFKNLTPVSAWGSQDFNIYRDVRQSSFYADQHFSSKTKTKPWDSPLSSVSRPRGLTSPRGSSVIPTPGSVRTYQDADRNSSSSAEKHDLVESGPRDVKGSADKKDTSHAKASETDTKRAKQQFAQRSRVRKLQYIAELERNVQALQAEGSEVSAELEFLNQQHLILNMENKSLKQRLESLSQEQLIKYLEHEVLERELGRLRTLYEQQQQPQQQHKSSSHRRANSRDLDQHLAALSLKSKDTNSASHDSVSGHLHI